MSQRVETKVSAASLAAAVAGAVIWALSQFVFQGGAVPEGVQTLVYLAVPSALSFAAGWVARHTPRDASRSREPIVPEPAETPPAP